MRLKFPSYILLIAIDLFPTLLLLTGCLKSLTQVPQWESGMFTPDGKYYAYTYNSLIINQPSKRGGLARFRPGSNNYYLQIIDCATGEKLLEKPFKSKELLVITDIKDNNIWLWTYNADDDNISPALFDLKSKKMAFGSKNIRKINPNVSLKNAPTFYRNIETGNAGIIEGDDGRKYQINPNTGILSLADGKFDIVENKSGTCYQSKSSVDGYLTTLETRKKIFTGSRNNIELESKIDFLNPEFLAWDKFAEKPGTLQRYNNNFFIISSSDRVEKKEMQLTMMDPKLLEAKWTISLPQEEQKDKTYNKERFAIVGNKLFISNATNFISVDVDKGIIVLNHSLF